MNMLFELRVIGFETSFLHLVTLRMRVCWVFPCKRGMKRHFASMGTGEFGRADIPFGRSQATLFSLMGAKVPRRSAPCPLETRLSRSFSGRRRARDRVP